MRILITGHKGLIGSSLWDRLKDKHQLYGYDIKDTEGSNLLEKVDMIIHCASYCIIREIIKDTSLMMESINTTYQIIEKAKNDKSKIILMSSSRLNSDYYSPYVTGKKFLEDIARTYKDCYDVDNIIIRPETIWGYHQDDSRVIPSWIKKAKDNEDIIVFGNKVKELSPLFVEDFSDELVKVIENFDGLKNSDPITITGEDMKVCEIIDIIKDFYYSESDVIFLEPELSQPQNAPIRKEGDRILKNRLREKLR